MTHTKLHPRIQAISGTRLVWLAAVLVFAAIANGQAAQHKQKAAKSAKE